MKTDFRTLPYGQKNRLLWLALAAGLLVYYSLAFRPTARLRQENQQLEARIRSGQNVKVLQGRWNELNSRLNGYGAEAGPGQSRVMATVSTLCQQKNLTLKAFPQAERLEQNSFAVETYPVVIGGKFGSLLGLMYELERSQGTGRVSSASFRTSYDLRRKKTDLTLTLYLQNLQLKGEKEK